MKTKTEKHTDREEKSLLLSKGSQLRKNKIEAERIDFDKCFLFH